MTAVVLGSFDTQHSMVMYACCTANTDEHVEGSRGDRHLDSQIPGCLPAARQHLHKRQRFCRIISSVIAGAALPLTENEGA
jgi:hypothetical protein